MSLCSCLRDVDSPLSTISIDYKCKRRNIRNDEKCIYPQMQTRSPNFTHSFESCSSSIWGLHSKNWALQMEIIEMFLNFGNLQQSVIHLNKQQSRVGTESVHGWWCSADLIQDLAFWRVSWQQGNEDKLEIQEDGTLGSVWAPQTARNSTYGIACRKLLLLEMCATHPKICLSFPGSKTVYLIF